MSTKRRRERLEKQRIYQGAYREAQAMKARPSRDDVARMLLHYVITERRNNRLLEQLLEKLGERLVEQGYDARETEGVLDDLVEKYRNGWVFRRKVHLRQNQQDGVLEASEH